MANPIDISSLTQENLVEEEERDAYDENQDQTENDVLDISQQLEQFREKWRQEIKRERKRSESGDTDQPSETAEEQARQYFQMASKLEQDGALYEAIEFYKMAMQLVPDIEHRMAIYPERSPRERLESESSVDDHSEVEDEETDLVVKFQNLHVQDKCLCKPEFTQRSCHISALPIEVINYIFKWVVSQQLDMKTLENLSLVCRGFYLCARDEELWRLSCLRVWGNSTGKMKRYGTWRNMFIERQHLQFVGCYISRMQYMRQGEKSLDNFYKPWHLVEYYRYLRFFSDGVFFMMTSPEEPSTFVYKLSSKQSIETGLLRGYYKMAGDKVTGVLKAMKQPEPAYMKYRRNKKNQTNENVIEKTFHVEFSLSNVGKKLGYKLTWSKYYMRSYNKQTGTEYFDEFDLKNSTFSPLYFSRVKSYTLMPDRPL